MDHGDAGRAMPRAEFDLERLAEISDGDLEFEQELAREYLSQARTLLAEMTRALSSGDLSALRRLAHTLKGSSRTVGAESVAAAAADLERASAGTEVAPVAAVLARSERLLIATERELDAHFGSDGSRSAA